MSIKKCDNFYYVEDLKLPSVTHILDAIAKPPLISWAAKTAAGIACEMSAREERLTIKAITGRVYARRDNAADLGSNVHDLIARFLKEEKIEEDKENPAALGYFKAFLAFWESVNPKLLFSEEVCYSKINGYAGTTDLGIELPNKVKWLCDFKTGGVYREAGLQMVAYKAAVEEIGLVTKIDRTIVIQLCANGTFNLSNFDEPLEAFLATKRLWEWTNNIR